MNERLGPMTLDPHAHGPSSAPSRPTRPGLGFLHGVVVLYVIAFLTAEILATQVQRVGRDLGLPHPLSGLLTMAIYLTTIWGLVALVRRKVERLPWADLGLTWTRGSMMHLLSGAGIAVGMLALVVGTALSFGWMRIEHVGPSIPTTTLLAGMVDSLFLVTSVAVAEELVFRGAVPISLAERLPLWMSVTLAGLLFGLVHVILSGFTPMVVVSAVVVTFLLMTSRLITGTLWWAVGWHLAWGWSELHLVGLSSVAQGTGAQPLLGLTLSGPRWLIGTSPFVEAGALVIGVELLGTAALLAWGRRTGHTPRWSATFGGSSPTPTA